MNLAKQNKYASALSTDPDIHKAAELVASQITAELADRSPDLLLMFVSGSNPTDVEKIHGELRSRLHPRVQIGCTAESVVGQDQEIEFETAISVWSAVLPHSSIEPFHLRFVNTPDGGSVLGWPDSFDDWNKAAHLILLPEPFTFPTDYLLERLADDRPGLQAIGGVASGGSAPGENRLFLNDQVLDEGCVGIVLDGGVAIDTVVSQGCRPIGTPLVITKSDRNVIHELGGKPAYDQLIELYESLPNQEKQIVQRQLHLGIVMSEYQDRFSHGDFLIRNVIGADPETKTITVASYVRVGQTVQFHLRDEHSADRDLLQRLENDRLQNGPADAALIFTCNGRGTRMFSQPHHDAHCLSTVFGKSPVSGFFAQGEIGPVGGKNFVHGFTASVALFREGRSA